MLCFWRCVAYHKEKIEGNNPNHRAITKKSKALCVSLGFDVKQGITRLANFAKLEEMLGFGLSVYDITDEGVGSPVFLATPRNLGLTGTLGNVCSLGICNDHFVYLKNLAKTIRMNYQCDKCNKTICDLEKFNIHISICNTINRIINSESSLDIYFTKRNILKKINNCKTLDIKNNFDIPGNYISLGNVLELLDRQQNRCYVCRDIVLLCGYDSYCIYQFSLDRIDNSKPHTTDNILISCYYCNCFGYLSKYNDYIVKSKTCDIYYNSCKKHTENNKSISRDRYDVPKEEINMYILKNEESN